MKRKIALILTAVLLGLAVCLPAAAAGAGTADDPLVTLSYLNETFLAAVQKRIDEAVASREERLRKLELKQQKEALQEEIERFALAVSGRSQTVGIQNGDICAFPASPDDPNFTAVACRHC